MSGHLPNGMWHTSSYEVLPSDLLELQELVNWVLSVIDKQEEMFLWPPVNHFLWTPQSLQGLKAIKVRPIVSDLDSWVENTGIYIIRDLLGFVESLPSYLWDITDLVKKVVSIDAKIQLVIFDVEALNSSIYTSLLLGWSESIHLINLIPPWIKSCSGQESLTIFLYYGMVMYNPFMLL